MKKSGFFFYGIALLFSVALMIWLLNKGALLPAPGALVVTPVPGPTESGPIFWNSPLAVLLLQIIVILLVGRALVSLTSRWGQPLVISEIIAGIILGPSLLGLFFPEVSQYLFPPESLRNLYALSQI